MHKEKQCNCQESTKFLNRSNNIETMAIENDNIIANLNLADIYILQKYKRYIYKAFMPVK